MTEPTGGEWGPCPAGELERLSAWLVWRRRLRTAAAVTLGVVAFGGLAGGGWFAYSELREQFSPPGDAAPCPDNGIAFGIPDEQAQQQRKSRK
jgi:hypothetical protein